MKNLFNFYLDDDVKKKATEKIERLAGEKSKGQLAALIRVLLKRFLYSDDEKLKDIIADLESEYTYSTTKNKRSKL